MIHCRGKSYDWTYYIDVYNNEIISSDIQLSKHGNDVSNHFNAYKQFLKLKEDIKTLRLSSTQTKVQYIPQKLSISYMRIIP